MFFFSIFLTVNKSHVKLKPAVLVYAHSASVNVETSFSRFWESIAYNIYRLFCFINQLKSLLTQIYNHREATH